MTQEPSERERGHSNQEHPGKDYSQPAARTWYHIILSTYGAWLRGDARGFRTRHHREHVDGDYKNPPPPGQYERLARWSRTLLKQPPVVVPPELRAVVGAALCERLHGLGGLVACLAVGGQHVHLLVRTPTGQARAWAGAAKRHAWFVLRERGWAGKLWGKRGKEIPIHDRGHQLNAHRYILKHADEGAWVWKWSREQASPNLNPDPTPDPDRIADSSLDSDSTRNA